MGAAGACKKLAVEGCRILEEWGCYKLHASPRTSTALVSWWKTVDFCVCVLWCSHCLTAEPCVPSANNAISSARENNGACASLNGGLEGFIQFQRGESALRVTDRFRRRSNWCNTSKRCQPRGWVHTNSGSWVINRFFSGHNTIIRWLVSPGTERADKRYLPVV